MKMRILAVLIALIMAAAVMPITSAETAADWTVPEGYNEHDYNKIATFLEKTDPYGVKNGEKYFPYYDVNDPGSWYVDNSKIIWTEYQGELRLNSVQPCAQDAYGILDLTDCIALESIFVTGIPGLGGHVTELLFSGCESLTTISCFVNQLTELDLSNCPSLTSLECSVNPLSNLDLSALSSLYILSAQECFLTELDTSCNPNLQQLWVAHNELTELDLSGNTELYSLWISFNPIDHIDLSSCANLRSFVCESCNLTEIDVSCCPNLDMDFVVVNNPLTEIDLSANDLLPLDMVSAAGDGTVGYAYKSFYGDVIYSNVFATMNPGANFIGWYTGSGELVSTSMAYNFSGIVGAETVLIARFTGGGEIPGDINMSGSVEVSDAILALRCAMGLIELDEAQFAAGDMNGSGTIEVADAIIILRTAMGID